MPAPIPPPPPQPSLEETRDAVRLIRVISVVAILLFLAYAQTFRVDGFFVRYGRENTASWMLYEQHRLVEKKVRAHEGGRVAWLVGSSILRESFDERVIDQGLQAAGSPFRVEKFGQDRGASGLSSGLLERLPVREGDLVLHSVGMENFLAGWLDRTEVPWWQVTMLTSPELWLRTNDWSPQEKLETLLSLPAPYWQFQQEAATGWLRWIESPWQGRPKVRRAHYTLTFHTFERRANFRADLLAEPEDSWVLSAEDIDLSETQFNVLGLARMRAFCEQRGARLVLADIPPRLLYTEKFLTPDVARQWDAWRDRHSDLLRLPQLPEADYYDMKHPNFRGREQHSRWLLKWLLAQDGA